MEKRLLFGGKAAMKAPQKGVRYKYVTFRLSACSTLDRLTIFSLLFGIPLYKLPQGTNNQVNVTYLYLTPFCHSGVTLLRDPTCLQWYLLISACRAFALNTQNYWFPH